MVIKLVHKEIDLYVGGSFLWTLVAHKDSILPFTVHPQTAEEHQSEENEEDHRF